VIVLDASAMLEQLLNTPKGQQIQEKYLVEGESFHVPHLLDLEVAQVLRRYSRHHILTDQRAAQALGDFLDLPLTRYPHDPLLSRIWELRDNFTAYDAAYVALAEVLNIPLVTCDSRLTTAPGHTANMILV
jgi:predicted nucleic acid-binding protein